NSQNASTSHRPPTPSSTDFSPNSRRQTNPPAPKTISPPANPQTPPLPRPLRRQTTSPIRPVPPLNQVQFTSRVRPSSTKFDQVRPNSTNFFIPPTATNQRRRPHHERKPGHASLLAGRFAATPPRQYPPCPWWHHKFPVPAGHLGPYTSGPRAITGFCPCVDPAPCPAASPAPCCRPFR